MVVVRNAVSPIWMKFQDICSLPAIARPTSIVKHADKR